MSQKKRALLPVSSGSPDYPTRDQLGVGSTRREFLRNAALGGVALGLSGVLGEAVASEPPVEKVAELGPDFSVLDAHEAAEPSAPPAKRAKAKAKAAPARRREASPERITENQALIIDAGYTLLFQWQRPADDDGPGQALGAAVPFIAALLAEQLNPKTLHDADRIAEVEGMLITMLNEKVPPAEILKLHLDHDCAVLCELEKAPPRIRGRIKRVE